MGDGHLLAGGRLHHLADAGDVGPLVRREAEAELRGVGDDVEHPAPADVDAHGAELGHLDRHVQVAA